MIRKIGLYFLSLWLLFFLVIVITIDIPICFSSGWVFIGFDDLFSRNIIPLICVVALVIGGISFYDFNYIIKGSPDLSIKISHIENIEYEHLSFLTTYIVPLLCFSFDNMRSVIVLLILLMVIGLIYIRTDLFYANPTLAVLGFRIYRISGSRQNETTKDGIVVISRDELRLNDQIQYIKVDARIYYAYKK